MNLSNRTFTFLIAGTLLVLAYVHEQVSILQISYSIEKKERAAARLSEDYKVAKFQIARLHSPGYLNQALKSRSLNLSAPKAVQIIKVVKPKELLSSTTTAQRVGLPPLNQPTTSKASFISWVGGFMREAQAKTSK